MSTLVSGNVSSSQASREAETLLLLGLVVLALEDLLGCLLTSRI